MDKNRNLVYLPNPKVGTADDLKDPYYKAQSSKYGFKVFLSAHIRHRRQRGSSQYSHLAQVR